MKNLIYLDYAATTPIADEVIEKMIGYMGFNSRFANPAAQNHAYGLQAHWAVEEARNQIAQVIHAKSNEIIWTSGATESNNLALKGVAQQFSHTQKKHIITSSIEHKAILDSCTELLQQGFEISYLKPEVNTGIIRPETVQAALRPDTLLVSLMWVNNELGTLTEIQEIASIVKANQSFLHVDAAQAVGKIKIDLQQVDADLVSFSGHKAYGPKGIGALFVRADSEIQLKAQMHGGGHEQGLRSGTLATHQIVGMAHAFHLVEEKREAEQKRISQLRQHFWQTLSQRDDVILNGDLSQSVANYLNVSFLGDEARQSIANIQNVAAVSHGSACNSQYGGPSHVLTAIGRNVTEASQAVRFSFGSYTTLADIELIIRALDETKKTQFVMF